MGLKRNIKRKLNRLVSIPKDLLVETKYGRARRELKLQATRIPNRSNGAVFIHLFYQDMWPYFSKKIEPLINGGMDLVVVLLTKDTISADIKKTYPNAIIVSAPNQGRDILPFLKLAKTLKQLNYEYVLKLHSKKSPQRDDGKDWADKMISDLVSSNELHTQIIATIQRKGTAIIGSTGNYVPLTTYYNDNQPKVHWLLIKIFGRKDADYINKHNNQYGFYAGTMFWVNLGAISEVLNLKLWANNFPPESAQLDGTTAHAIERLLCVVPEYSKMDIYEVSKRELKKIPHKTEYIPEWSDYHHGKEE